MRVIRHPFYFSICFLYAFFSCAEPVSLQPKVNPTFSYSMKEGVSLTVGMRIQLDPTFQKNVEPSDFDFSVLPPLPFGLSLETKGRIIGIPQQSTPSTVYMVASTVKEPHKSKYTDNTMCTTITLHIEKSTEDASANAQDTADIEGGTLIQKFVGVEETTEIGPGSDNALADGDASAHNPSVRRNITQNGAKNDDETSAEADAFHGTHTGTKNAARGTKTEPMISYFDGTTIMGVTHSHMAIVPQFPPDIPPETFVLKITPMLPRGLSLRTNGMIIGRPRHAFSHTFTITGEAIPTARSKYAHITARVRIIVRASTGPTKRPKFSYTVGKLRIGQYFRAIPSFSVGSVHDFFFGALLPKGLSITSTGVIHGRILTPLKENIEVFVMPKSAAIDVYSAGHSILE